MIACELPTADLSSRTIMANLCRTITEKNPSGSSLDSLELRSQISDARYRG